MNKTELVAALAEKTQLPKKNAELALNAVVEVITESLSKGDKVQIVGFGSFEVKDRPERIARNPQKPEEEITIPASCFQGWQVPQGRCQSVIVLNTIF